MCILISRCLPAVFSSLSESLSITLNKLILSGVNLCKHLGRGKVGWGSWREVENRWSGINLRGDWGRESYPGKEWDVERETGGQGECTLRKVEIKLGVGEWVAQTEEDVNTQWKSRYGNRIRWQRPETSTHAPQWVVDTLSAMELPLSYTAFVHACASVGSGRCFTTHAYQVSSPTAAVSSTHGTACSFYNGVSFVCSESNDKLFNL